MEVLASVLGSFVAKPAEILCDSIYSKVRSAFKFKSHFNALIKRKKEMREILNTADKEEKSPNHQVKEWLEEVEGIEKEVNPTQADTAGNGNILCGCCSNCCLHYRLGKKVAEKLEEVNQLMKDANFPDCILVANRQVKPVEHIRGPVIESQTAASKNLDKIMDLLNDDAVRIIGIWGMGGVGKTTLVRSLNKQLESKSSQQPFGIVIWVTVSKDFDLEKVQTQIAKRLNLDLKPEGSEQWADKLYQRLRKEEKFLLILDDVWKKIDFDSLGVPQPEEHMGAKIILTSRLSEVCTQMRAHPLVKVDVLTNEEAWQMFIKYAGEEASLEHIKPYAEAIAKECGRLPLALIIVGAAMRGKYMLEQWKNALNELQQSKFDIIEDVEEQVYKPLRWSYDSLQGKNIKPCFLYCSLFPEDFSIKENELLQCWMADGLIDEKKFEDSHAKGIATIKKLKDSCLLEEGFSFNSLKMHDVVRDVAIWIASSMEYGCRSLIFSSKGLSQISDVELLKSSKRISFIDKEITNLPDCVIQCPKTSTLFLQGTFLERVPEQFLQGFQVLRVLNMNRSRIKSLPLSLTQLAELRALLLQDCSDLEEISPLGGLRKLQVLDLSNTHIKELPKGIEELSNLSQLNLSKTPWLKTIPARVISRLSSLEVLKIVQSGYKWGVIEEVEEGQATLEVLGCLTRLTFVYIDFGGVPCQEYFDWIQKLKGFAISVCPNYNHYISDLRLDLRRLFLSGLDLSEKKMGWLLISANHLTLSGCRGIDWMFEYLITNTQVLAGLKFLYICDAHPFRGCPVPHDHLLPNLEVLVLWRCNELESVWWPLEVRLGLRFSRLRSINVYDCLKLKYLIPVDLIPYLINLEEIKIRGCGKLENVFEYDNSSDQIMAAHPVLPKLRILQLDGLPELRSICRSENLSWQSLEVLQVVGCKQLKRLPLTTQNANTIKEIRGEEEWWSELEWDDDNTNLTLLPRFKPQT